MVNVCLLFIIFIFEKVSHENQIPEVCNIGIERDIDIMTFLGFS